MVMNVRVLVMFCRKVLSICTLRNDFMCNLQYLHGDGHFESWDRFGKATFVFGIALC